MILFEADITPVPKPRMTRADTWKKRPSVERYWNYKDEMVAEALGQDFTMPASNAHITFYLPMPKTWSKKKQAEMVLEPHQQKPDIDNLTKAVFDSLLDEDSYIYDIRATKRWALKGSITIETNGGCE